MMAPGLLYLLVNNVLPLFGLTMAFKDINFSQGLLQGIVKGNCAGLQCVIYYAAMIAIDPAIYEAAELDGAGPMRVFFQVVLPLSLPIFATVGFLQASIYWNDWFNAMLYINDGNLMGLQAVMNQMLTNLNFLSSLSQNAISGALGGAAASPPTATIRMAMAVLGILPSLILFPVAQKYLVQGLTLGGAKE